MGDQCLLEITMRKADLPRFVEHVVAQLGEQWDFVKLDNPDLITVRVHGANYGWCDERQAAADAGIPFLGMHDEGRDYGAHEFASLDGEQLETPLTRGGDHYYIALDDELKPIESIEDIRNCCAKLKAVKQRFGIGGVDGHTPADQ